MDMVVLRTLRSFACSAVCALACLGASVLILGLVSRQVSGVAAASNHGRADLDRDGLSDLQELVIGTQPYRRDTDGDTYSDLDERARGSDPRDLASVPEAADYGLGMCASQENGYVTALCAVYAKEAVLPSMQLKIGIVYNGRPFMFSPNKLRRSRDFLYLGRDPGDTLVVVEVGIPEALVRRLRQVNLFSVLRSTNPGTEPIVSLLPIVNFSGVAMLVEQGPAGLSNGGGGATGVTYRPLAADDQIPSTWNGGQMCFQATAAVGTSGASIVHEIGAADCIPMDTYCSPGDCAAGVGQPLELPDPAALAGG
jgi:hypothetical protein